MTVFVDLTNKIYANSVYFAFYDTVNDLFVEIGGQHTFDGFNDFLDCCKTQRTAEHIKNRLFRLIPEDIETR